MAGPLPMLFIIASVHAAMMPAVLRAVILRGVECAVVSCVHVDGIQSRAKAEYWWMDVHLHQP